MNDELLSIQLWSLFVAFEARLAHDLQSLNLSVAAFRLVGEVMQAPEGIRQSVLATRLGVRPPTVSAAVSKLESQGVLVRTVDPDDPRAFLVSLKPGAPIAAGASILQCIDDDLNAVLSPEQRSTLSHTLTAMIGQLTSTIDRSAP